MKRVLRLEKTRVIIGLTLLFCLALAPSFLAAMAGSWPFADDAVAWFAPARQWARASLASGVLPLWNPHLFLGMPFLGNGQTAVFYPFNIVYWFLPIRWALLSDALFHGALLGIGGYFLARVLARSRLSSILCAVCLMLGNGVAAHLYAGHMTWHAARAYLPWEIAVLILYLRAPKQRYAIALALLFALQFFSGYPPYVVWSLAWCGVFWLAWRVARKGKTQEQVNDAIIATQNSLRTRLTIWLRHWPLAGVLLLLLAALAVLPFREMSRLTSHGVELTFSQAIVPSSNLSGWARLILPTFFGGNNSAQWSLKEYPHEEAAFIGFIPLLLALGAPFWLRKRENQIATLFSEWRFTLILWAVLPIAMLMALGNHTPIYKFAFDIFPPLRLFRAPARWMEIWYFAACILAAFSFDAIRTSVQNREILVRILSGATVVFILLTVAISLSSPANFWLKSAQWNTLQIIHLPAERAAYAEYLRQTALMSCMFATGISLVSILAIRCWQSCAPEKKLLCQILLIALIALDILWPFWSSARFVSPQDSRSNWPTNIASFYVPDTRWAVMLTDDDVNFGLNQGMPRGIDSLGGYDPLSASQFFDLAGEMEGRKLWSSQYQPSRFDSLWRVAGVTHVYISAAHPFAGVLPKTGAKLIAKFGDEKNARQLWRLNDSDFTRAWPRFFLAYSIRRAPIESQLSILKQLSQKSPTVVVEPNVFPEIHSTFAPGKVLQLKRSANSIHLQIETPSPQILVQIEAISPGWRAWVNGRETKMERANYLFRGVVVPAGKSKVAIIYENQTFRFAAFLSLCGLSLLAGVLGFAFSDARENRLKRRRSSATRN